MEEYEYGGEETALAESDAFYNVGQGLQGRSKMQLVEYWQQAIDNIERIGDNQQGAQSPQDCFKTTALPLARIKKVMKTDSEVKMISAEAPILFAKGCDIFITELTMRAWIHAEESKRRTLQRSDIATALQKSDMFDFLIDIVPREEAQPRRFQDSEFSQTTPQPSAQATPAQGQDMASAHESDPQSHEQEISEPHLDGPLDGHLDGPLDGQLQDSKDSEAAPTNSSPSNEAPQENARGEFEPAYQMPEFQQVKLERQYDDFEYQSYEQVDV